MNVVVAVLNFISQQILNVPAYLIGIIAAVGLIALKKPVGQVVSGGLKAAMGYLILGAGATVVTAALDPFGTLVFRATGAQGVVPTNEVISAQAATQFGAASAYIIVLSFILMLLIARFTPLKYIFLTGHHMVFMSMMLALVLSVGLHTDQQWLVVIIGSLLMAVIMVAMPAFTQPFTNRVTNSDKISVGHFNSLGYMLSGALGAAVGKKSKSTEDINFPKALSFLRDSMVSTTLLMVVLYLVFAIWAAFVVPADQLFAIFPSKPTDYGAFIMAAFAQALQFGIGVSIILYGVRIILGELVPAFQGIANKVVPGAKPALDIPIVFPYGPNASLIGFLSSFVGGLVALGIIALWLGPLDCVPVRPERLAHRLPLVLRGRSCGARHHRAVARPAVGCRADPAGHGPAFLRRRWCWRLRQCDWRPQGRHGRRICQRPAHHVPARLAHGRHGVVRTVQLDIR